VALVRLQRIFRDPIDRRRDPFLARASISAKGTIKRPGKNVRPKAGPNSEILDTSPGMMIAMLRYKAERADGWFAVVNARNTSQECRQCGRAVPYPPMRALQDGGPPRRRGGPERPETGRSGSVERLCARKQRPDCRPSLRKPHGRSSPPNSSKDFELTKTNGRATGFVKLAGID
jgi:hypothetical protein